MTIRSRGGLSTKTGTLAGLVQGAAGSLIDPTTALGVQPNGRTGFTLTFSDEFAGSTWDPDKWIPWYPDTPFWNTTTPGGHLTNSNEPEAYHPSGLSVAGSAVTLTMRNQSTVSGIPYTSGMLCSYPSYNPLYGYAEARMQLSTKNGSWPAFWMMPTDQTWPPEIDIMENFDGASTVSCTYHRADSSYTVDTPAVSDITAWHTYGVWWQNGRLRWYIDGALVKDEVAATVSAKAMYLIVNLAGTANLTSGQLPVTAQVDYIRFWQ